MKFFFCSVRRCRTVGDYICNIKTNNENKAKALEENKKNYSSENSTPQNGEDIISNEDAEKLEGGIKHEDLERPSEGSLGGIICCNG